MDEKLYRIIRQAKRGSKESFSLLLDRYKNHVYLFAYGMLGDRMEAEDVSQEAFTKAYYSLPKLEKEAAFGSWLTRITANLCYDRLKKNKLPYNELTDYAASENSMEQHQVRLSLEEAMQHLSPEHRETILLKDVQGYSYEEIAEILKIPLGTVKSRINTARLRLRNELNR